TSSKCFASTPSVVWPLRAHATPRPRRSSTSVIRLTTCSSTAERFDMRPSGAMPRPEHPLAKNGLDPFTYGVEASRQRRGLTGPLVSNRCRASALRRLGLGAGFDRRHGGREGFGQPALANGSEHGTQQVSPQVLAFAYHDGVDVSGPIGLARERVGVARF